MVRNIKSLEQIVSEIRKDFGDDQAAFESRIIYLGERILESYGTRKGT